MPVPDMYKLGPAPAASLERQGWLQLWELGTGTSPEKLPSQPVQVNPWAHLLVLQPSLDSPR